MILQHVPGLPLLEGIAAWPRFDEMDACVVMKQLTAAVDFFHNNRIVHRVSLYEI